MNACKVNVPCVHQMRTKRTARYIPQIYQELTADYIAYL